MRKVDVPIEAENDAARQRRIEASRLFVDGIELDSTVPAEEPLSIGSVFEEDLMSCISGLRQLAQPREELPARLAKYRLLRVAPIRKFLLRLWNYLNRSHRTQAEMSAKGLELLHAEFRRMFQNGK